MDEYNAYVYLSPALLDVTDDPGFNLNPLSLDEPFTEPDRESWIVHQDEDVRYNTFRYSTNEWPHSFVSPSSLVAAGFYYEDHGDCVRCPWCNIGLCNWTPEDDPFEEHRKASEGKCWFVNTQLGGLEHAKHRYPWYRSLNARLNTFTGWRAWETKNPFDLASQGLFFAGKEDAISCFSCGGTLTDWQADSDPAVEHAKHFPECALVADRGQEADTSINIYAKTSISLAPQGPSPLTESVRDESLCLVCCANKRTAVFLPCLHNDVCGPCSEDLKGSACPMCDEPITDIILVFK